MSYKPYSYFRIGFHTLMSVGLCNGGVKFKATLTAKLVMRGESKVSHPLNYLLAGAGRMC